MKRAFAAIAVLLSTTSIGVVAQPAPPEGGAYTKAIDSSVRVLARRANGDVVYGTGWVVHGPDADNRAGASVIVTARHVIVGAVKIAVVESGQSITEQKPATLINAALDQDIAFLEVKDLTKPAVQITRTRPAIGDDIAAAGYTGASDNNDADKAAKSAALKRGGLSKYFRGKVDADAQAPIDQVEFDAPVLAGFSGGPLLNSCGRAVGMTITDGGHINIADGASIATAQGVATAVASDEIIRAARAASVDLDIVNSSCGPVAAPTVTPTPPAMQQCPEPDMTTDASGKPCIPVQSTPWQVFFNKLKGRIGLILGLVAVALVLMIVAIVAILKRRSVHTDPVRNNGNSTQGNEGSSLMDKPDRHGNRTSPPPESTTKSLRLTGRGGNGEVIDLRFTADELRNSLVVLGVEGSPNGLIPDSRPKRLISGKHALLSYDGRNFTIEDNRSTNGTKIAGRPIAPNVKQIINPGDTITLADVQLLVTIN